MTKTPCRDCDNPTNFAVCRGCGWAVCGRCKRHKSVKVAADGTKTAACQRCATDGF